MQDEKKPLSERLKAINVSQSIEIDLNAAISFLTAIRDDVNIRRVLVDYYEDRKRQEIEKAEAEERKLAPELFTNDPE